MAKGRKHSPEIEAAVMAALLAGQGVNEVARQHQLSPSVVSRIKSSIDMEKLEQAGIQKKEKLIDLVEGHLIASFKAAIALAEQAHDASWRNKHSASDIAVCYGVLRDKAFKLVEFAGRVLGQANDTEQV